MMKIFFKLIVFGVIVMFASKLYIVFATYQALSMIKAENQHAFLLTYKWISTDFDGTLSIEGIEFTPYKLKRTYAVDRLDLHFSGYVDLLTNLSGVLAGNPGAVHKVVLPDIRTELKGGGLKEWLSAEYSEAWVKPFHVFACGNQAGLTDEHYQSVGIREWRGSLSLELPRVVDAHQQLNISLDAHELGRIQLETVWQGAGILHSLLQKDWGSLRLMRLNLMHQDAGFFRRLNIMCSQTNDKDRAVFSTNAANAWRKSMFDQGLLVNMAMAAVYRDYLLQGGQIMLESKTDKPFRITELDGLLDKEIVDFFNIKLSLNDVSRTGLELVVDRSIIFPSPPEVQVQAVIEPPPAAGYRRVEKDQLSTYIGHRIRVIMINPKFYEGLLNSVTDYNIEVMQNLPGGRVYYPLMLNEIEQVEMWFN